MAQHEELNILSETEEGYIGICRCCSVIHLLYRNIAIKLDEDQFSYFSKYINELNEEHYIQKSMTGKNIFMATPVPNIVFCFSTDELKIVRAMLNEATLMLEVNKIFK